MSNKICEFCKMEISDSDEVITCPKCGKIYHKECWEFTECYMPSSKCGNNTPEQSAYQNVDAQQNDYVPQQPSPLITQSTRQQKKKSSAMIANVLGAISGIVSIFMGITIKFMDNGSSVWSNSYGGDAYTGIQNAAADTANNVMQANNILQSGFCCICVSIGLAVLFYFISKIIDVASDKK